MLESTAIRNFRKVARLVLLLLTAAVIMAAWGCEKAPPPPVITEPEEPVFRPVNEETARRLTARLSAEAQEIGSWTALRPALEESLDYLAVKAPSGEAAEPLMEDGSPLRLTWGMLWRSTLRLMEILPELDENPGLLAERFVWYEFAPVPRMTGYHIPEIEGSLSPRADYPYPVYGLPEDLEVLDLEDFHPRWKGQKLVYRMVNGRPVPYFDRRAIDFQGALDDRGVEIAWVKDLAELFHLQTQGSGVLRLPGGHTVRIGYAGKNGRQFRGMGSIFRSGRYLGDEGLSKQNMAAYLDGNPGQVEDILSANPSYVFFRLLDGPVVGSMGRGLEPRVSVATDPMQLPLGSLLVLETTLPTAAVEREFRDVTGIFVAQDTGGAIKGSRLDFYWGPGEEAERRAWRTNVPARTYLLLAK